MADNVAISEGTGTNIAADDVGGVKYQRVKTAWGVDGSAVDTSATDPMPVVQTGTPALPTGASTAANQSTGNASLATVAALSKAEDAAHNSGDPGVMLLAVRKDTAAALAGTDGDYIPMIVDASGRLHIAALIAGEAHIGEVGGNMAMISTEFTRPADTTAYAANDVVSDSTGATTMQALANAARVSGGSGYIVGIRVTTDKKSVTPRVRVHFYNTTGATLAADNAAWKEVYADVSKRVASWDLPAMTTGADTTNSDMSRAIDMTCRIPYTCAATSLYYVLETLDAFTPASGEKVTVTVFMDRN